MGKHKWKRGKAVDIGLVLAPQDSARLIANADGGCWPNPGPASFGVVIIDPSSGREVATLAHRLGMATNNVAELAGVTHALLWARAHGVSVDIRTDSRLAACWVRALWKVKLPSFGPAVMFARELLASTRSTVSWVPRELNASADLAAEVAMRGENSHEAQTCPLCEPVKLAVVANPKQAALF